MSYRWRAAARGVLWASWLTIVSGVYRPAVATADCMGPGEPTILWSYPSAGQTGVPINADVLILPNGWDAIETITLNGRVLSRSGAFNHFDPGPLAPNTAYEVSFQRMYAGQPQTLKMAFTTGSTTLATRARKPVITGHSTRTGWQHLSSTCHDAINAMGCHDLGEDTHLLFESSEHPLVWLIERVGRDGALGAGALWPGVCGTPELYTRLPGPTGSWSCVRLSSVDETGAVMTSERHCPEKTAQEAAPHVDALEAQLTAANQQAELALHAKAKPTPKSAETPSSTQPSRGMCTALAGPRDRDCAPVRWLWCGALLLLGRRRALPRQRSS